MMTFKGKSILWLMFFITLFVFSVFFLFFSQEAFLYEKKDRDHIPTPHYSNEDIMGFLNSEERIDSGRYYVISLCYRCHDIQRQEDTNVLEKVSDSQFFMNTYEAIYHGRLEQGMPAWKQRFQIEDIENISAFLTKIRAESQLINQRNSNH